MVILIEFFITLYFCFLIGVLVTCSILLIYEILSWLSEGRREAYLHFFDEGDDDDK